MSDAMEKLQEIINEIRPVSQGEFHAAEINYKSEWNETKALENLQQDILALIAASNRAAVEEALQGLVCWEDQESDIDGRPVSKPYHVLCGNCRESIEMVLARLGGETERDEN